MPLFSRKVEFDYGSETSIIFLKEKDSEELSKKNNSEVYRFLFELDDNLKKESGWLSVSEAIQSSYRIEGENNEVLDEKSYLRSIHIYNEKSYNRINLRCVSENTCKIIYFTMASSRF
ncbi:MAG: hypothetical protein SFU98_18625 [Leptospiraceae bacterium]|nr:hypothetical protein [Leptospiraceae bacterium]